MKSFPEGHNRNHFGEPRTQVRELALWVLGTWQDGISPAGCKITSSLKVSMKDASLGLHNGRSGIKKND